MKVFTGLTKEQLAKRPDTMGGSDANILMSGDPSAIHDLWLQKTRQKEPDDLSAVLPVRIGIQTEPLNVEWFQRETGIETDCHGLELSVSKGALIMSCTLDGATREMPPGVLECKHVNQFAKFDEVLAKYMPQLQHNIHVTQWSHAYLSVFIGTFNYQVARVDADPFYIEALIDREKEFWSYVIDKTPPPGFEPVVAPLPVSEMRTVDMSESNEWGNWAGDWLDNEAAKKKFDKAVKEIKALIEPDVAEATGHGITAKRSKSGAITIRKEKS